MEEVNMETCFDGKPTKRIKLELADRPLNFADPVSHRIIEKRRRDRMNNCLADLSRLIPSTYLKQGQGRIEKTEIIELAIKHIEHLTKLSNYTAAGDGVDHLKPSKQSGRCCEQKFYMGFKECQDELMRYFVEEEGWDSKDKLLVRIMNHLDQSSAKFNSESGCMDENGDLQVGKMEKDEIISDDGNGAYSVHSHQGGIIGESGLAPMQMQSMTQTEQCMNTVQKKSVSNQHLRTLLTRTGANNNDSVSVGSNSSCLSLMSLAADGVGHMRREEESGFCSSNVPFEGQNALSEPEQNSNSNACEKNVYKFKHNITKRFSLEEKHHIIPGSDTSSSSSQEDSNVKVKRRMPRAKAESPSSDETPYPNSDHSSYENITNCDSPAKEEECGSNSDNSKHSVCLPAFLLHPSGTHYVPFSVHSGQVKKVLSVEKTSNPSVFHPISIPVNFGGNYISMQNINIDSKLFVMSLFFLFDCLFVCCCCCKITNYHLSFSGFKNSCFISYKNSIELIIENIDKLFMGKTFWLNLQSCEKSNFHDIMLHLMLKLIITLKCRV
ncbi:hypothetical protein KUTeg_021316, partial [Tegillarca granosa]